MSQTKAKCFGYIETSAKMKEDVQDAFQECINAHFAVLELKNPKKTEGEKKLARKSQKPC